MYIYTITSPTHILVGVASLGNIYIGIILHLHNDALD